MGRSKKETALFDIRLKGAEHDVFVVKGSSLEAPSILLSGTIVLSVLEPMNIKKLSLTLYSTLRLKWTNTYETPRGVEIRKPYRYEKRIFEHNWDNFEIQNYFSNLYDNYGSNTAMKSKNSSANSSSSSLKNFAKRSKSSSSLANLTSFGSSTSLTSQSHTLLQGNYEFPFSAILPGSILESVEGLPGASLVYKLQANIERSRFSNDLIAKRHIRIVRTLTPDTQELSETMAVDNTWPKKVEYTISTPSKAVAIGSLVPTHMLLVPLAKGLKLGTVKVSLVEYFSCSGSYGPPHIGERVISKITVPSTCCEISEDKWEVTAHLPIPPSLSKCTQDVDILTNIKVRHKLKYVIGLVNPDGHVSELRASLPISLFISPFVALGVKNYDRSDSVADNSMSAFAEISEDANVNNDDDDVIFAPDPELDTLQRSPNRSAVDLHGTEIQAPPMYENHIYDRLWSEIPIDDTPDGSNSHTPAPGTPTATQGEGLNMGTLTENLRRLHMQQRLYEQGAPQSLTSLAMASPSSAPSVANATQDDDDEGLSFEVGGGGNSSRSARAPPFLYNETPVNETTEVDYFSVRPHDGVVSPGAVSPGPHFISRVNSGTGLSTSAPLSSSDWDADSLSRVPSYKAAMKSPTPDGISPAYDLPGYEEFEMSRPKSIHLKPSSLANSRNQSTALINNLRGNSDHDLNTTNNSSMAKSSISSSLPASSSHSRTQSFVSDVSSTPPHHARTPSLVRKLTGGTINGITPLSQASVNDADRPTLQSSNRSSSFVNMFGSLVGNRKK